MLNESTIKALEDKGFCRWTKGNYDRLYLNAESIGLECEYYKTGNISGATLNGERISNSQARAMKWAKTYIDIKTGKIYGDNYTMTEAAKEIYASVTEA